MACKKSSSINTPSTTPSALSSKLAVLDFDDPESLAFHYPLLPHCGTDRGVPTHFLGLDTDFENVDKKIKQYRKLNDQQQAIQRQKWTEMEDWEKETFLNRIDELKRMQQDLQNKRAFFHPLSRRKKRKTNFDRRAAEIETLIGPPGNRSVGIFSSKAERDALVEWRMETTHHVPSTASTHSMGAHARTVSQQYDNTSQQAIDEMLLKAATAIDTVFLDSGNPTLPKISIGLFVLNEIRLPWTGGTVDRNCDNNNNNNNNDDLHNRAEKPQFTI
ncbi:unnamed protein product [Cylindrotheca closterium]|uniref:Uncharacterized protein n=1 Tax=Cylindrotheca closterium TaxID=2856 RepID=A0AAD2FE95_9STRA|nr:unnamed protein product [Cylindrotheca closterium]